MLEIPSIPTVVIALAIKFTLQLTCEKDVGMGLYMFNFMIMLSLHLVSVYFHPYICLHFCENVFLYLFLSIFSKYINIMHASITVELLISCSQVGDVNKACSDPDNMYTSCQDHWVLDIRYMLYIQ